MGEVSTPGAVGFVGLFPQPLWVRFDRPDSGSDAGAVLLRVVDPAGHHVAAGTLFRATQSEAGAPAASADSAANSVAGTVRGPSLVTESGHLREPPRPHGVRRSGTFSRRRGGGRGRTRTRRDPSQRSVRWCAKVASPTMCVVPSHLASRPWLPRHSLIPLAPSFTEHRGMLRQQRCAAPAGTVRRFPWARGRTVAAWTWSFVDGQTHTPGSAADHELLPRMWSAHGGGVHFLRGLPTSRARCLERHAGAGARGMRRWRG